MATKRRTNPKRYTQKEISSESYDSSDFEESEPERKRVCKTKSSKPTSANQVSHKSNNANSFSKNALMARENRLRKKRYIENLENELKRTKEENDNLKNSLDSQNSKTKELETEVKYLKSLIFNSKEIGHLLRTIRSASSMNMTSSLITKQMNTENVSVTETHGSYPEVGGKVPFSWDFNNFTCPEDCESTDACSTSCRDTSDNDNVSPRSNEEDSLFFLNSLTTSNDKSDSLFTKTIESSEKNNPMFSSPETDDSFFSNLFNSDDINLDKPLSDDVYSDALISDVNLSTFKDTVEDHPYSFNDSDFMNAGVCLHVANNKISIEFCSKCSSNSNLN